MKPEKFPFYYGGVVTDKHFCNRRSEIEELRRDMEAGLNVLMYAPRRFGKTSLVLKALENVRNKYIFIDLMGIVDAEEFINGYFNALSVGMGTPVDKIVTFFKKILNLRPNITVQFDESGKPGFSLNFLQSEVKTVLSEVLDLPYRYATQRNERIIVVFDEFQHIINLGIEEKMRSVVQHHGDMVSYIFMGSKKSVMQKLFYDKTKPFYKSVKHLPIDAITEKEWIAYIQEGFASNKKTISEENIRSILTISKRSPYYSQQIAYELFTMTEDRVEPSIIQQAIDSILGKEEDLFLNEWDHLSQHQKKALKLLVYASGKNVYSKETMEPFHFTSSSLKKAIEGLIGKDVIDHRSGTYYFQDPLFEYWLKRLLKTG